MIFYRMNTNKITIDINIPFYNYGQENRIEITEKYFQHLIILRNKLKEKINLSFTFIGSEKESSRNLVNKYFNIDHLSNINNDTYYEFNQDLDKYSFNTNEIHFSIPMLNDKFRFSFEKSMEKKPNITLLNGSNDFISVHFFHQIIDFYKNDKKQLFGIDNYYNGNNAVFFPIYQNNKITEEKFWWTGLDPRREIFKYCGGIIGFNDFLYNNNYEQLINSISCDEGSIEHNILNIDGTEKFNSKNIYYINMKTYNNSELNTYNVLKHFLNNEILFFDNFEENFKESFKN